MLLEQHLVCTYKWHRIHFEAHFFSKWLSTCRLELVMVTRHILLALLWCNQRLHPHVRTMHELEVSCLCLYCLQA